ncbi:MAG: ATP-binding protein [Pseudomonadota bacterium]
MDDTMHGWRFDEAQTTNFDFEEHVDCPTSRLIESFILEAIELEECRTIIGPPGCGKSATAKRVVSENRHIRYVTATPSSSGLKAFLRNVCSTFGVYTSSLDNARIERDLWNELYRLLYNYPMALICDEAQNLDLKTLRTALFLHDQTGLPVILIGNSAVLNRTRTKQAAFDQIADRQGPPLEIDGISRRDVEAFGIHHKVEGREAYELLVNFGEEERSFRGVVRLLKRARSIAGPKSSIHLSHLQGAASELLGRSATKRLIGETEPKTLQVVT